MASAGEVIPPRFVPVVGYDSRNVVSSFYGMRPVSPSFALSQVVVNLDVMRLLEMLYRVLGNLGS